MLNEWMDHLRFYTLFNSVSVILGLWEGKMKGCALKLCLRLERFPADLEPRTARSAGHCLTELTGLLTVFSSPLWSENVCSNGYHFLPYFRDGRGLGAKIMAVLLPLTVYSLTLTVKLN